MNDQLHIKLAETGEKLRDAVIVVGQLQVLAGGIKIAVERRLGDVDADDGERSGIAMSGIVLHGGYPVLRIRTAPRGRVQPAVRVKYTRSPVILLRDGVMNAWTRSIYRRPSLSGLFAT